MSFNFSDSYMRDALQKAKDRVESQRRQVMSEVWKPCTTCAFGSYYGTERLYCKNFNAHPPLDVVIVGCEHWEDDIPF